jgi:hypothetical protein
VVTTARIGIQEQNEHRRDGAIVPAPALLYLPDDAEGMSTWPSENSFGNNNIDGKLKKDGVERVVLRLCTLDLVLIRQRLS